MSIPSSSSIGLPRYRSYALHMHDEIYTDVSKEDVNKYATCEKLMLQLQCLPFSLKFLKKGQR
uniref:Sucrose nonfermenting 4-like protein n=1 Tax=Rhizophora mucronata TaxID=61149 RepID=A0A2P2L3E6_RHIMU